MSKFVRFLNLPAPKRRKKDLELCIPPAPDDCSASELCCARERRLDEQSMRLVLMTEFERTIVYDSSTVVSARRGVPIPGARKSEDGRFWYYRRGSDLNSIGELLFGSTSTSASTTNLSSSVKIHSLGNDRIMVSRVFTMKMPDRSGRVSESAGSSCESDNNATVHSLDGLAHCLKKRSDLTIPLEGFSALGRHQRRSRYSSMQASTDGSGHEDEMRDFNDWDDLRALSPPHRVHLKTRRTMTLSTESDTVGVERAVRERLSSLSWHGDGGTQSVGIGVIMEGSMRKWILQHMPLLEVEMRRMEAAVVAASATREGLMNGVDKGWKALSNTLAVLYNTPRLRDPVWLHLQRNPEDVAFASHFCSLLAHLRALCDTKHTRFFLSTIVSAVLSYHMAWIASAVPPPLHSLPESAADLYGCGSHLGQYLEMSGCVGQAACSSRTVVLGTDIDLISKIIHLLSFFIRCSVMENKIEECESPMEDLHSPKPLVFDVPQASIQSSDVMPSICSPLLSPSGSESDSGIGRIPAHSFIPAMSTPIGGNRQAGLPESLLTGPADTFNAHFVLSGLVRKEEELGTTLTELMTDGMATLADGSADCVRQELFPGSPIPHHVTIVADCVQWRVMVLTGDMHKEPFHPSEVVMSMMEQLGEMHHSGFSPRMLTELVEDALSDMLGKSLTLVELVEGGITSPLSPERAQEVVGCDNSDLRLLVNVGSVYCPQVLQTIITPQ